MWDKHIEQRRFDLSQDRRDTETVAAAAAAEAGVEKLPMIAILDPPVQLPMTEGLEKASLVLALTPEMQRLKRSTPLMS